MDKRGRHVPQDKYGEVKRDSEGKTISQLQYQGIVKLAEAGLTDAKRAVMTAQELAARLLAICQQRQQEVEERQLEERQLDMGDLSVTTSL